jgi:type VI secretion system protein ImpL
MLVQLLAISLVVIGGLFLVLLWLVTYLAHLSFWIPGILTGLALAAPLGWFIWRRTRAKKGAKQLEKALASQAKQQVALTRPDLQKEVQQMQSEFEKAVFALKKSKLGNSGRDALYLLPWYSIIGPPGVGKTTALRHSGLKFPYLSNTGGGIKGLGGTRNCDWWLTNQAVLIDTAGRWATQEEDHDEWLAFLDLLKKYRPKKPLNGLITAISIADLAAAQPDDVRSLAERMRERVDEVMGRLSVSLPIYVLFTKCDLLPGFVDTFSDMARGERAQVWGFTAPLAQSIGEPGTYFQEAFDELLKRLEIRSLDRMADERRLETRWKIYILPQQLDAIKEKLAAFISVLFQEDIYRESPRLRGAYFSSGTQEGRTIDLIVSRLAAAIGVKSALAAEAPVVDRKSFFLHDVFMKIIFEDRDIASVNEATLRFRRVRNLAVTALLGVVALALGFPPSMAWKRSAAQLRSISALVETQANRGEQELGRHDQRQPVIDPKELEPLRRQIDELEEYQKDGVPWSMGFGMYRGDLFLSPLRSYLGMLVSRLVVEPLMAENVQNLSDFGWKYAAVADAWPSLEEHAVYRELLKLHLFLSAPRAEDEPPIKAAEKAWIIDQLASRWARPSGSRAQAEMEAAKNPLNLYLDLFQQRPSMAFGRDEQVVKRARNALNRLSGTRLAFQRIVKQLSDEGYDINLATLVGSGSAISAERGVRGAFTRRAWDERVRDHLLANSVSMEDAWVLGIGGKQEAVKRHLEAELADMYFRAYIEEWQQFIDTLQVERPRDNQAALILLQDLTRGQPPALGQLIREIYRNVTLVTETEKKPGAETDSDKKDSKPGVLDRLMGAIDTIRTKGEALKETIQQAMGKDDTEAGQRFLTAKDVGESFTAFSRFAVPPHMEANQQAPRVDLEIYQEQLAFVRDALQRQKESPNEEGNLNSTLEMARTRVKALIESQDVGWRPRFQTLLWPPVEGATVTSVTDNAHGKSGDWCNEIAMPFHRILVGKYPFNRDGADVALSDFTAFYQPHTGAIWQFYDKKLKRVAPLRGERFTFETALGEDAGSLYTGDLLTFLERSQDITAVFFPGGSSQPSVRFEVRINPAPTVATTTLTVAGQSIEYHNGPEQWYQMAWPGEKPGDGAQFVVRGANGMHERVRQEGEWGFFRLLESGTVTRTADRLFSVGWRLPTHQVDIRMDFRPARAESPFFGVPGRDPKPTLMQFIRVEKARAPSKIVRDAERCETGTRG